MYDLEISFVALNKQRILYWESKFKVLYFNFLFLAIFWNCFSFLGSGVRKMVIINEDCSYDFSQCKPRDVHKVQSRVRKTC